MLGCKPKAVCGYHEHAIVSGAQTERRGEAGPVRVLRRGWHAPAARFSSSGRPLREYVVAAAAEDFQDEVWSGADQGEHLVGSAAAHDHLGYRVQEEID